MSVIYPEATPALGMTSVKAVQDIAIPTAPDLSSEINDAASVDVSCFLRDFNPGATQSKGQAPRRLCTKVQLDKLGQVQPTIDALRYVYDPQADDTTDENKAKATLTEGTEVWLVERRGLDAETVAFAATQRVNLHHVRLGAQIPSRSGDDEYAEFEIVQEVEYVEPPVYDVAIVA